MSLNHKQDAPGHWAACQVARHLSDARLNHQDVSNSLWAMAALDQDLPEQVGKDGFEKAVAPQKPQKTNVFIPELLGDHCFL